LQVHGIPELATARFRGDYREPAQFAFLKGQLN
jgi:hypothetical protein